MGYAWAEWQQSSLYKSYILLGGSFDNNLWTHKKVSARAVVKEMCICSAHMQNEPKDLYWEFPVQIWYQYTLSANNTFLKDNNLKRSVYPYWRLQLISLESNNPQGHLGLKIILVIQHAILRDNIVQCVLRWNDWSACVHKAFHEKYGYWYWHLNNVLFG